MSVVSTFITTLGFKVTGAADVKKAEHATDGLTRSQTRLGQASAGSGRTFAAQSKGLGGIVAAYAGAAATIFALQAAFTALSKAAQVENVVKGTNTLAAAIGTSGPKVLASLKEITQGQISLADTAKAANLALSSGFTTKQLDNFAIVASKASLALGRDFSDAFDRIVKGSAKLEPELLDELGILTRLNYATKVYAKSIGVSALSLTQFQKTQAFANAVIEEGLRKFSNIDTTVPSTQKSLSKLESTISNLTTTFAGFIANGLKPLVDYFNNNSSAALTLFIGLLLVVFKKAESVIGDFATSSIASLTGFFDKISSGFASTKKSLADLKATQIAFDKAIDVRGGVKGNKLDTKDPLNADILSSSGNFNQKGVDRPVVSALTASRTAFRDGTITTVSAINTEITALKANQKFLKENTIAYRDVSIMIKAYEKSITQAGIVTRIFTGTINTLRVGLSFLGKVASGMLTAFNWVFAISAVLQIFGVDIIGGVVEWFNKGKEAAEKMKVGVVGIFTAASGGAIAYENHLKSLGATTKDLENLQLTLGNTFAKVVVAAAKSPLATNGESNAGLLQEIYDYLYLLDKLAAVKSETEFELQTGKYGSGTAGGAAAQKAALDYLDMTTAEYKALNEEIANNKARYTELTRTYATQDSVLTELNKRLLQAKSAYQADPSKDNLLNVDFIEQLIKAVTKYNFSLISLIGNYSSLTGIGADKIADIFNKNTANGLTSITQLDNRIKLFGIELIRNPISMVFDTTDLKKYQTEIIQTAATTTNALNSIREDFARGSASLQGMSSVAENTKNNLVDLRDQLKNAKTAKEYISISKEVSILEGRLRVLQNQITEFQKSTDIINNLNSAFSKQINLVDNLTYSGDLSARLLKNGKVALDVATTSNKVYENRLTILRNIASANEQSYKLQQSNIARNRDSDAQTIINAEAYELALKAAAGTLFDIIQSTAQIAKQQQQITNQAREQLEILKLQNAISEKARSYELTNAIAAANMAMQEKTLAVMQATNQTDAGRLALMKKQTEEAINLIQAKKDGDMKGSVVDAALPNMYNAVASENNYSTAEASAAGEAYKAILLEAATGATDKLKDLNGELITANELAAKAEIAAKIAVINQERTILGDKYRNDQEILNQQADIAKANIAVEKAKIAQDKINIKNQYILLTNQLAGYTHFALGVQSFADSVDTFNEVLTGFLSALPGFLGAGSLNVAKIGSSVGSAVAAGISQAQTSAADAKNSQIAIADARLADLDSQSKAVTDKLGADLNKLSTEYSKDVALSDEKLAQVQTELVGTTTEATNAQTALAAATESGGDAAKSFLGRLKESLLQLFDAVQGRFETLMSAISDNILYGDGNLMDSAHEFFKGLQQDVFKNNIAKPFSEAITSKLFGSTRYGIENATIENGALSVNVKNWARNLASLGVVATGDAALDKGINGLATNFAETVFGADSAFTKTFDTIFGQNGIFTTTVSSIFGQGGPISGSLGGIVEGILGAFGGAASGGLMHMAQGGSVARNMVRDRVPAMLEPGEFVLRKHSVKAAGLPAINALNATGQMSGGAPIINFTNEGSPKEVEATPKFNGEKYVIDIITRDLRNNGPIRQSMRNG